MEGRLGVASVGPGIAPPRAGRLRSTGMAARARKILIVDDNGVLRALLAQALEAAGYVAIAADSGESALEVARFEPPDLCVVDQVMPGMSSTSRPGRIFAALANTAP